MKSSQVFLLHQAIIADVGLGVHVGHMDSCKEGLPFDQIIHIYRNDHPNYHCYLHKSGLVWPPSMSVEYKDGESLLQWFDLDALAEYIRQPGSLLIHCAVGQTRSPTLAVFALVVRGLDPFTACQKVLESNWKQRGIVSNLCITPLKEIFEWWENKQSAT